MENIPALVKWFFLLLVACVAGASAAQHKGLWGRSSSRPGSNDKHFVLPTGQDKSSVRRSSASGEFWHQHLDNAIYTNVAISLKGYVGAATDLNPPEMVESFKISGERVANKSSVTDWAHDETTGQVAMSRNSTICAGVLSNTDNRNMMVFAWDLASSHPEPLWAFKRTSAEAISIDVSRDGSLVLLADVENLGSDAKWTVTVYNGRSEKVLVRYATEGRNQQLRAAALSDDGLYVAWVTRIISQESVENFNLTVTEYNPVKQSFGQQVVTALDTNIQSMIVSSSAEFIAVQGYDNRTMLVLKVFRRADADKLTYARHDLVETPYPNDLVAMAFSPEGLYLATTWINRDLNHNQLVVYDMRTQKQVFSYLYPVEHDGDFYDKPCSVAMSDHGEYVVVGSWGTKNKQPGTEQVQVFKVGVQAPIFKHFIPGSALSVDMVKTDTGKLYVVAGGKKNPADVLGEGGDLFMFEVNPAMAEQGPE
eukprot:scpid22898/ scgid7826/ 